MKHLFHFKKYSKKEKRWNNCMPPNALIDGLLDLGHWRIPSLSGIITAPTLSPDMRVISQKGYDERSRLYLELDDFSIKMPAIPEKPTRKDALAALATLRELLCEFPFECDLDESVALASILTAVARGAFEVAPMFLCRAHTAGSGKSYLVTLVSHIVTGYAAPVTTLGENREEIEKRLGAIILEGSPVISLDNCTRDLDHDLLCQMVEQSYVKVRILGKSEMPACEWRGVLFATGNNVSLTGDMIRRGLTCNLDAKMERPEMREFKSDPVKRVMQDRGKYIAAALTLILAYHASGESVEGQRFGTYKKWSKVVQEPLIWLGLPDPVKSTNESVKEDPERNNAEAMISICKELFGEGLFKVRDIVAKAEEQDTEAMSAEKFVFKNVDLRDLLLGKAAARNGRQIDPNRVGYWLRNLNGRVFNGHMLKLYKKDAAHGSLWTIVKV